LGPLKGALDPRPDPTPSNIAVSISEIRPFLDVLPFIEAVEKMRTFYKSKKLDLFKDGVSLPGLVLKYLMKGT
jgi:hypothetical protein